MRTGDPDRSASTSSLFNTISGISSASSAFTGDFLGLDFPGDLRGLVDFNGDLRGLVDLTGEATSFSLFLADLGDFTDATGSTASPFTGTADEIIGADASSSTGVATDSSCTYPISNKNKPAIPHTRFPFTKQYLDTLLEIVGVSRTKLCTPKLFQNFAEFRSLKILNARVDTFKCPK
jgi:hypothetical protein